MGAHSKPKPSPYSVAAGSVSYALALVFAKHIPVDVIAAAPAVITAAVAAVEQGVAEAEKADPNLNKVGVVVDRLAVQAAGAAADVARDVAAGVAAAPSVAAVVPAASPNVVAQNA